MLQNGTWRSPGVQGLVAFSVLSISHFGTASASGLEGAQDESLRTSHRIPKNFQMQPLGTVAPVELLVHSGIGKTDVDPPPKTLLHASMRVLNILYVRLCRVECRPAKHPKGETNRSCSN